MNAMKLLMIDNYDSFTYNLVQYFGELGAQVEVFRNDEITVDGIAAAAARRLVDVARALLAGRGRHLGGGDPAFRRQAADPGRLPGAPAHRRGIRRQDRARPAADARQDQRDHHHARGRLRRPAREVHRQPLPLAGDRAKRLPGRAGDHGLDRRRRDHGRAPQGACRSRACSSIPSPS